MKPASRPAAHSAHRKRPDAKPASVFGGSKLPMWIYDAESLRFLDANQAALDALGYCREEILRLRLTDLMADGADPHTKNNEAWEQLCRVQLRRKDGSLATFEMITRTLEYHGTQAKLATMDPTGADDARTAAHFRDLFDNTQALMGTHDLRGNLLSINPWAAHVLGYEPEELVGRNLADLVAPEARRAFRLYLRQISRHGSADGELPVLSA